MVLSGQALGQWSTSGTNAYYNSGNVGIGTSSPGVWFPGKVLEVQDNRPILNLESTGILSTISFINTQVNPSTHVGEFHLNHFYDSSTPSLSTLTFATYPAGNALVLNASGNVGIGTTTPTEKLHISGSGYVRSFVASTDNHAYYTVQGGPNRGSFVDYYRQGSGRLWHTGLRPDTDNLEFRLDNQNSVLTLTQAERVGIGTKTPGNKLEVNGTIRSKEVIVEVTGWPDYVFEADYELPTLAEIEAFIKANKHLPGISSAEEVEENGQHLGDTQKQLLKKMEEMTLYMIELKKENEQLKRDIHQLKSNKKF